MDVLVNTGRVVLKARYSIYPIQLCCVGQTGYVGQTDQGYRARAEGTIRLHTRWRAYSTQTTSARSPYSSAVGQTGQGYRVRAEGTIRLHTKWRAYSTQAATARVSPARLRPCESPTRLRPYPIRTPSYGVNRMSCLRHWGCRETKETH